MSKAKSSYVDEVIDYASEVFQQRIHDMGDLESGAYTFYASKLAKNMPLTPQEKALLGQIAASYHSDTTFYEVGAGVGYLCMALAAQGYCAVALDADQRRIQAATFIREKVAEKYSLIEENFAVQKVRLGSDSPIGFGPSANRKVIISTNLVNGWTHDNGPQVVTAMSEFDDCIVDLLMFGIKRERSDAHEVISMFSGKQSELFLDLNLKGAGLYFRFRD